MQQVGVLGRGEIQHITWLDEQHFAISGERGTWTYPAADMTHPQSWALEPIAAAVVDDGITLIANQESGGLDTLQVNTTAGSREFTLDGIYVGHDFSADGQWLAAFSRSHSISDENADAEATLKVWNVLTGELLTTQPNNYFRDTSDLSFSPDSQMLVAVRVDGTLTRIDLPSGEVRASVQGYPGYVQAVAFTPDASHIMTGSDENVIIWDVATQQELDRFSGCWSVAIHPTGDQFICGKSWYNPRWINQSVRVRDLHSGVDTTLLFAVSNYTAHSMGFNSYGSVLAVGSLNGEVSLWDTLTGIRIEKLREGLILNRFDPIYDIQYIHDTLLVTGGAANQLWDLATGAVYPIEAHLFPNGGFDATKDARLLAFTAADGNLYIWSLADVMASGGARLDNALYQIIPLLPELPGFVDVAFSPDGSLLAALSWGLYLYDAQSGELLAQYPYVLGNALTFSPDGRLIVTYEGQCLRCELDESVQVGAARLWAVPG